MNEFRNIFYILLAVLIVTAFLVFLGCAADPNRESMEECIIEHWHGVDIRYCNE